jgi:hypothetical protein
VKREAGDPRVRLVDNHVALHADGSALGVAVFDLEPAGLAECVLELPTGSRLIHAFVEGLSPAIHAVSGNVWQLPLGPDQLPQRIKVIFKFESSQGVAGQSQVEVFAPKLRGLPVMRTLWTVQRSMAVDQPNPSSNKAADPPAQQDLVRLQTLADFMTSVADGIAENSPHEISDWYSVWNPRLAEVMARLTHATERDTNAADQVMEQAKGLAVAQAMLARRQTSQTEIPPLASEMEHSSWGADRLQFLGPMTTEVARSSSDHLQEQFVFRVPAPVWNDVGHRLLAAAAIISLLLLLALPAVRRRCEEAFAQWPHLAGVLLGLLWVSWFAPHWLGWLILLASVSAAFRSPWRSRTKGAIHHIDPPWRRV